MPKSTGYSPGPIPLCPNSPKPANGRRTMQSRAAAYRFQPNSPVGHNRRKTIWSRQENRNDQVRVRGAGANARLVGRPQSSPKLRRTALLPPPIRAPPKPPQKQHRRSGPRHAAPRRPRSPRSSALFQHLIDGVHNRDLRALVADLLGVTAEQLHGQPGDLRPPALAVQRTHLPATENAPLIPHAVWLEGSPAWSRACSGPQLPR